MMRDVRCGSKAVFPNSVQNVRSWVKSGPQFLAAGGLLVAEAVEELELGAEFDVR